MSKFRKECVAILSEFYVESRYWKALLASLLVVVTAPIVVPTRILYKLYRAVTREGI